jgi:hypothetical protein
MEKRMSNGVLTGYLFAMVGIAVIIITTVYFIARCIKTRPARKEGYTAGFLLGSGTQQGKIQANPYTDAARRNSYDRSFVLGQVEGNLSRAEAMLKAHKKILTSR